MVCAPSLAPSYEYWLKFLSSIVPTSVTTATVHAPACWLAGALDGRCRSRAGRAVARRRRARRGARRVPRSALPLPPLAWPQPCRRRSGRSRLRRRWRGGRPAVATCGKQDDGRRPKGKRLTYLHPVIPPLVVNRRSLQQFPDPRCTSYSPRGRRRNECSHDLHSGPFRRSHAWHTRSAGSDACPQEPAISAAPCS